MIRIPKATMKTLQVVIIGTMISDISNTIIIILIVIIVTVTKDMRKTGSRLTRNTDTHERYHSWMKR